MGNVQISIVVPVYNVEKYIEKNIQSLLALKYTDVEFIYVDDGTQDGSICILKKYAKKDSRLRIIHQKNSGLSAARNAGIKVAQGNWILFVDGDDWVDTILLQNFLSARDEKCDVIWGGYNNVDLKGNIISWMDRNHSKKQNGKEEIQNGIDWLLQGNVDYVAWVYLYKTEFLKRFQLSFPVGLLHEDMEFVPKVFTLAQNVKKTNICYYRYLERPNSISRTKDVRRSRDLLQIANHMCVFFKERNVSILKKYGEEYVAFLCEAAVHLAVLSDIQIESVIESNNMDRKRVVAYIMRGTRFKDKIMGILLFLNFDMLYARLYKLYRTLQRKLRGK